MVKRSFWDWLAWVALGYILVWTILKMTGVINIPEWLLYSPAIAAIYFFATQMTKLNQIAYEVEGLKKFRNETVKKIHEIELNCMKNHGK